MVFDLLERLDEPKEVELLSHNPEVLEIPNMGSRRAFTGRPGRVRAMGAMVEVRSTLRIMLRAIPITTVTKPKFLASRD